jgi:hypothetical protein
VFFLACAGTKVVKGFRGAKTVRRISIDTAAACDNHTPKLCRLGRNRDKQVAKGRASCKVFLHFVVIGSNCLLPIILTEHSMPYNRVK